MLKYTATDTSKKLKWTVYGEDALELYQNLVEQGFINTNDVDPLTKATAEKYGHLWADLGDDPYETLENWYIEGMQELSSEEILEIIGNESSKGYYYEIEEVE